MFSRSTRCCRRARALGDAKAAMAVRPLCSRSLTRRALSSITRHILGCFRVYRARAPFAGISHGICKPGRASSS